MSIKIVLKDKSIITKTNQLMMFRDVTAIYSKNHSRQHTYKRGKNAEFLILAS